MSSGDPVTVCTHCRRPITGLAPDVAVCGHDQDVMHLECARKVMGGYAFLILPEWRIEEWKRGRR